MSINSGGGRLEIYVPVAERIADFYLEYPGGRILTDILDHDREAGFVVVRAEVYRNSEGTLPSATGHAYEMRSEGHVNKTSYIENGETSAVGRALQNLGLDTRRQPQAKAAPAQSKPLEAAVMHGLKREIEQVCNELYSNPETRKTALARVRGMNEEELQNALRALKSQLAEKKERVRLVGLMHDYFHFQLWDADEQERYIRKQDLSGTKLTELTLDELITLNESCQERRRRA